MGPPAAPKRRGPADPCGPAEPVSRHLDHREETQVGLVLPDSPPGDACASASGMLSDSRGDRLHDGHPTAPQKGGCGFDSRRLQYDTPDGSGGRRNPLGRGMLDDWGRSAPLVPAIAAPPDIRGFGSRNPPACEPSGAGVLRDEPWWAALVEEFGDSSRIAAAEKQVRHLLREARRFLHRAWPAAPGEITASIVEAYMRERIETGDTPKTVRNVRSAISRFCRFLRRRGLLAD